MATARTSSMSSGVNGTGVGDGPTVGVGTAVGVGAAVGVATGTDVGVAGMRLSSTHPASAKNPPTHTNSRIRIWRTSAVQGTTLTECIVPTKLPMSISTVACNRSELLRRPQPNPVDFSLWWARRFVGVYRRARTTQSIWRRGTGAGKRRDAAPRSWWRSATTSPRAGSAARTSSSSLKAVLVGVVFSLQRSTPAAEPCTPCS